jgi:hypothetical protein
MAIDTFIINYFKFISLTSRLQLTPVLDKPAFSRIPLNSEPRIVVKIFGKFVKFVKNGGELPTADSTATTYDTTSRRQLIRVLHLWTLKTPISKV